MAPKTLVTGGAGFIGSHTCVELLQAGHEVHVVDNLDNSSERALDRVRQIADGELFFHRVDLRDRAALDAVFERHRVDFVIHFAGLKAVGESTEIPLRYYDNNIVGTLVLLDCMGRHGVRDLIFSSSCTVYGEPRALPLREDAPRAPASPYGRTKLVIEQMLEDAARADDAWRFVLLRYFNPVGAHPSGLIGEDPRGVPNNLLPYVMQVAVGRHPHVRVFGGDWPTRDGTGVRDYIHVVDLAQGHLAALAHLPDVRGCSAFNLGTGGGTSVLEVLAASERATGQRIRHEVIARRDGDIAEIYADPSRAKAALAWSAVRGLDEICADAWRWQSGNPDGYGAPLGSEH